MTHPSSGNLDETHDPGIGSWVESAGHPDTDFPLQNLPLGVFRERGAAGTPRIGSAIGSLILDLAGAHQAGLLADLPAAVAEALGDRSLNRLMALGRPAGRSLRLALHRLFRVDSPIPRPGPDLLVDAAGTDLLLPAVIGDYSDFYASIHHATNVGSMFRPDQPLLPNYKWVPIGYHGRASSVVPSGTPVRRPAGQTRDDAAPQPTVGPTRALDYECEVAAWVGSGNALGVPVPIALAEEHLFGLGLLNDWSARDLQRWEYQPLGPFLAKSFATTVSPWVVTLDALEPFRIPASPRPPGDPEPLAYLDSPANRARGGFDVQLRVHLTSARMRSAGLPPLPVSRASLGLMYWTLAQLVAHHASNGCNLRPGDLLGTGTISGETRDSRGCLLELTWRGEQPLSLPTGETRRFLEDGDEVIMTGRCERPGFAGLGFGPCSGVVG